MEELSIIIVNWNTKEILLQCLQSLIDTTHGLFIEIIVVDNGSTDGSVAAVKLRFPQVKIICNDQNLGFAKANNIGIKRSKGHYVCLINSDIVVLDDTLHQMRAYMNEHPSIGILAPKLLNQDLTPQLSCKRFPTLWNNFCVAIGLYKIFPNIKLFAGEHIKLASHIIQLVDVASGAFWMVRREGLQEVGLLDDNFFFYGEDIDWCKRFWQAKWQVVYFPQARAIHYNGRSSAAAPTKYYIEFRRARLKYWKKHHNRFSQICYLAILFLHQIIRIVGEIILYTIKPSERKNFLVKIKRNLECIRWLFHFS